MSNRTTSGNVKGFKITYESTSCSEQLRDEF